MELKGAAGMGNIFTYIDVSSSLQKIEGGLAGPPEVIALHVVGQRCLCQQCNGRPQRSRPDT